MKKLLFLVGISFLFFTSCIPNPEENPDPPAPPFISYFKADHDSETFFGVTTQAIVNDEFIAISALKPNGELFQITMTVDEEPTVGTYTFGDFPTGSTGFAMAFMQGTGNVPYIAAPDDSGTFADYPDYVDTAELVISNIDTIAKTITGRFKFTGVRFAAGGGSVETKEITNGMFSLKYLPEAPPGPATNTFTARLDDDAFVPTAINGILSNGNITLVGRKGSVQSIGLTLTSAIGPGEYDLADSGDYVAQYIRDTTPAGSSFAADQGTLVITSHDTANKRIIGTFEFIATSFLEPGTNYEITEGAFDITYQ